jgi:hypothetical protein
VDLSNLAHRVKRTLTGGGTASPNRVQVPQPERNLQIRFTRQIAGNNDFVAYIDAIGRRLVRFLSKQRGLARLMGVRILTGRSSAYNLHTYTTSCASGNCSL